MEICASWRFPVMGFVDCDREGMMLSEMMTCRDLTDFLDDYVSGALAADRREEFEDHLRQCADCRKYLDSYRRTIALSKGAMGSGESGTALEMPEALRRAIEAGRRGKRG